MKASDSISYTLRDLERMLGYLEGRFRIPSEQIRDLDQRGEIRSDISRPIQGFWVMLLDEAEDLRAEQGLDAPTPLPELLCA